MIRSDTDDLGSNSYSNSKRKSTSTSISNSTSNRINVSISNSDSISNSTSNITTANNSNSISYSCSNSTTNSISNSIRTSTRTSICNSLILNSTLYQQHHPHPPTDLPLPHAPEQSFEILLLHFDPPLQVNQPLQPLRLLLIRQENLPIGPSLRPAFTRATCTPGIRPFAFVHLLYRSQDIQSKPAWVVGACKGLAPPRVAGIALHVGPPSIVKRSSHV